MYCHAVCSNYGVGKLNRTHIGTIPTRHRLNVNWCAYPAVPPVKICRSGIYYVHHENQHLAIGPALSSWLDTTSQGESSAPLDFIDTVGVGLLEVMAYWTIEIARQFTSLAIHVDFVVLQTVVTADHKSSVIEIATLGSRLDSLVTERNTNIQVCSRDDANKDHFTYCQYRQIEWDLQ